MKGFLVLGVGAFLTGAAVAVAMDRRTGLDEDFGEDPNWPAVPYTAATHPDSPQEQVNKPSSPPPPAEAEAGGESTEAVPARSLDGSGGEPATQA